MARQRTFAERASFHWIYVVTSDALAGPSEEPQPGKKSPLSLREEASSPDGLCFIRVLRQLACGDLYQTQAAASPDLLCTQPLSVFFTEEQLAYALPYDCRLEAKSPERILAMLHAHAAAVRPLECLGPTKQQQPLVPAHSQSKEQSTDEVEPEPETVIIPLQMVQEALAADPACKALGEQKQYRPSRRGSLPRILVRSALEWNKRQREETRQYLDLGWREESQLVQLGKLRRQRNRLYRALQQHEQLPVQIEILPIYASGRKEQIVSCRMDVDIPVAA